MLGGGCGGLSDRLSLSSPAGEALDAVGASIPEAYRLGHYGALAPQPHRLVADVDAALCEQVLDVPQRQRETDVHHHHQADHLG